MKTTVVKRSIAIAGHKTSVSIEDAFWRGLKEIAKQRRMSIAGLVDKIDTGRDHSNLSSAIRLFVLDSAMREHAQRSTALAQKKNPELDEAARALGA
jgi:predicted DNA-binding ribbon-helix-helix protein